MPETIGQRLKKAREARYLTLEKASEETRIRKLFLQALEADDFSVMPSAAQGRGFLRNYADYLDLDIDSIIAEMQRNAPAPEEVSGPLPQVNLVETEVPPLTDEEKETPSPRFWTRWFARQPKPESAAETLSPEPKPEAETEEVKAEAGIPFEEIDQAGAGEEAKPGLFAKLKSLVRFKVKMDESNVIPEMEKQVEEQVETPQPSLPADAILAEIGAQLRERRELISLTVEEVERHTRLRAAFVKSLEKGAFDELPSPVQTRGMLASYAAFLDLDTDAILLRFADALQARHREKYAETPREKIQTQVITSMPLLRTFIAGDLIFGVVMIALLAALAIWGVGRVMNSQAEEEQAQPTAPSIADVLGDAPTPTASLEATIEAAGSLPLSTPIGGGDEPAAPGAPTPETTANVTVSIFALERVFVRISVDGEVAFEGRMVPRETKVFEAENQVVILTGNASALRVTYNGRDLGIMGGIGEVVSRVYLESGVATPTATIPPTPTNTPIVTPTRTPSVTPTATPPANQ